MYDERAWKGQNENEQERDVSFNKLRTFCLSLFYHDSEEIEKERDRAKLVRDRTVYYLLYIFFPIAFKGHNQHIYINIYHVETVSKNKFKETHKLTKIHLMKSAKQTAKTKCGKQIL